MKIKRLVNGYLEENCYIISEYNKALIIDPGSDFELIKSYIEKENLKVVGVLVTHYHFDHVLILKEVLEYFNTNVYDYKFVNKKQKLESFEFLIIDTKGHSKDSVTFYFEKENIMFTGDFLFKETIGNYEDESEKNMMNSLNLIKTFDKNIKIYPGHESDSTIGYELLNNPYLKE